MVTEQVPAVVGRAGDGPGGRVDASPAGSPVAVQVGQVAADDESVAVRGEGGDGRARQLDWLPGLVTATVLVTVQVNLAEPESRRCRWR